MRHKTSIRGFEAKRSCPLGHVENVGGTIECWCMRKCVPLLHSVSQSKFISDNVALFANLAFLPHIVITLDYLLLQLLFAVALIVSYAGSYHRC
jgi:hypothetical protein